MQTINPQPAPALTLHPLLVHFGAIAGYCLSTKETDAFLVEFYTTKCTLRYMYARLGLCWTAFVYIFGALALHVPVVAFCLLDIGPTIETLKEQKAVRADGPFVRWRTIVSTRLLDASDKFAIVPFVCLSFFWAWCVYYMQWFALCVTSVFACSKLIPEMETEEEIALFQEMLQYD